MNIDPKDWKLVLETLSMVCIDAMGESGSGTPRHAAYGEKFPALVDAIVSIDGEQEPVTATEMRAAMGWNTPIEPPVPTHKTFTTDVTMCPHGYGLDADCPLCAKSSVPEQSKDGDPGWIEAARERVKLRDELTRVRGLMEALLETEDSISWANAANTGVDRKRLGQIRAYIDEVKK